MTKMALRHFVIVGLGFGLAIGWVLTFAVNTLLGNALEVVLRRPAADQKGWSVSRSRTSWSAVSRSCRAGRRHQAMGGRRSGLRRTAGQQHRDTTVLVLCSNQRARPASTCLKRHHRARRSWPRVVGCGRCCPVVSPGRSHSTSGVAQATCGFDPRLRHQSRTEFAAQLSGVAGLCPIQPPLTPLIP